MGLVFNELALSFFGRRVEWCGLANLGCFYKALLLEDLLIVCPQICVVSVFDVFVVGPVVTGYGFVHAHLMRCRVLIVAKGGAETVDLPALYLSGFCA